MVLIVRTAPFTASVQFTTILLRPVAGMQYIQRRQFQTCPRLREARHIRLLILGTIQVSGQTTVSATTRVLQVPVWRIMFSMRTLWRTPTTVRRRTIRVLPRLKISLLWATPLHCRSLCMYAQILKAELFTR